MVYLGRKEQTTTCERGNEMYEKENGMAVEFKKTTEEMALLAAYVAGLVREGVAFKMHSDDYSIRVRLTGGY